MESSENAAALLSALDEPALIVRHGKVVAVNDPARRVLGSVIEGTDVRLAIRHPEVLEHILPGRAGTLEITGLGELGRPWTIDLKELPAGALLVRMIDRSASAAAEKMRVDFVANASHELRTPLATIIGYAETLADEPDVESELRARFGSVIRDEARRMLRIVEDLMSLSRIESERFVPPSDKVDLYDLLNTAAESARRLGHPRKVKIDVEAAVDLPPIVADEGQVLQLLDNLLTNAVRYACVEEGCQVVLSAQAMGGSVRISVRDSGVGIPREHLHRVTERFYRIDAGRSRDSGGTGLGLSIVKHIVERHRGTLDVHSVTGQGTEVIVTLPIGTEA